MDQPNNFIHARNYYEMALAFKHSQEAELILEEQRRIREAEDQWKVVAEAIRTALPLPVDQMKIFVPAEDALEAPRKGIIYSIDCVINPLLFGKKFRPGELRAFPGVIRVQIVWDTDCEPEGWTIRDYTVYEKGEFRRYEDPRLAFLAAFDTAWYALP